MTAVRCMSSAVAGGLADTLLQDLWAGRETVSLALPPSALKLEPADVCTLDLGDGDTRTLLVTRVEDAGLRRIEARTIEPDILAPVPAASRALMPASVGLDSPPEVLLLDLPLISGSEPGNAPRIAAFAEPWPGAIAVALGTPESGFARAHVTRPPRHHGRVDGAAGCRTDRPLGPRQRRRADALWRGACQRAAARRAQRRQCRGHRQAPRPAGR